VLFTADAHRDNGRRSIVQSDEKLTAFLELERMTSVASSVWRADADVGYLVCRLQRESFPSLAAQNRKGDCVSGSPNAKLFINYRRENTAPYAGRLTIRSSSSSCTWQAWISTCEGETISE